MDYYKKATGKKSKYKVLTFYKKGKKYYYYNDYRTAYTFFKSPYAYFEQPYKMLFVLKKNKYVLRHAGKK